MAASIAVTVNQAIADSKYVKIPVYSDITRTLVTGTGWHTGLVQGEWIR